MLMYLLFWILFRASASVIGSILAQLRFGPTKKYELLMEVTLNLNESKRHVVPDPPKHFTPISYSPSLSLKLVYCPDRMPKISAPSKVIM
jgi:hypothetical protein